MALRRSAPRSWIMLVAAAALSVTGCSGIGEQADPAAGVVILPPSPDPGTALPLDAYGATPDDQERSDRAQLALEQACLSRYGLSWSGPGEPTLLAGRGLIASRHADRFGLVDPVRADRYGYHPPPWDARTAGEERHGDHDAEIPAGDVGTVLFGTSGTFGGQTLPAGGCRGEASRTLAAGADQRSDATLLTRLEIQAATEAAADERLKAVVRAWSACMAEAGLSYPTPGAAARDPRWDRSPRPTATELAVARADVRCKERVGHTRTAAAVTAEYQHALITSHAEELDRIKRSLTARIANVRSALGIPHDD